LINATSAFVAGLIGSLNFTPGSSATGSITATNPDTESFTFTRASTATFVGSNGLLQTAASGVSRIDYLGNTAGHILLEPASTNLVLDSEDATSGSWAKLNVDATAQDAVSPTGSTDAWTFTTQSKASAGAAGFRVRVSSFSAANFDIPIGEYVTASVFAKKNSYDSIVCKTENFSDLNGNSYFHLHNGTLGTLDSNHHSHKIEDYGNGWYRLSLTLLQPSGASDINGRVVWQYATSSESNSVPRTGTEIGYWYGSQVERISYSTSYIETTGTSVTRVAETATGAGDSTLFNDSEGVLYAEISALANDLTNRTIGVLGDSNNFIELAYRDSSNQVRGKIQSNGVVEANIQHTLSDITLNNKLAIKYKLNDVSLYVNGVEVGTDLSANMPSGLNELNLNRFDGGEKYYGKVKEVRVYKEALTDTQLQNLTS
jgi:hypothetical protein